MTAEDGEPAAESAAPGPPVSGDLPRVLRPRRALPTDVVRPTRAQIHLGNLRHNLRVLKKVAGSTPVWGVVKADGYGHGAKAIARTLERAGVDGLCVALVEEGVELREAGIRCPILVMGGYYGNACRELEHHRLTPVLQDTAQVLALARAADVDAHGRLGVHLKVDTGMARLGARPPEWKVFAQTLMDNPQLHFQGLMTHLACADTPEPGTMDEALERFERATSDFAALGLKASMRHAANSAALLRHRNAHYDMVRPGLALYGVDPLGESAPERVAPASEVGRLRPVMSVHSRIVSMRELPRGESVGYGATWKAERPSRIATVAMGYADGLSRSLSNRGALLVRGQRAPIAGVVSMDMTMIDVTEVAGASIGDEVVLLGQQKVGDRSASISANEVAGWCDTIAWEILTNISRRVPRFYREG